MARIRRQGVGVAAVLTFAALQVASATPIHVTYLWHMHQPVYYPYESVQATDNANRFNFSVAGVHGERAGNYTSWPKEAVEQGHNRAGLEHSGAQVSFSGSLGENLQGLWGGTWYNDYRHARNTLRTSLNNPRLDMVGIAYHHSLMPLTCKESMKMQIKLHKEVYTDLWGANDYTKGFWPPECAFAEWMIPALVEEGLEWVIVDNGHFDRACQNYPWVDATSIRPNGADMLNPDPASIGSSWVQLQNVWAPSKVSAPWGYQPHRIKHVNPYTGAEQKMIAVPAARYEGNENGRGGYGAFKPENVWGSKVGFNNDPNRPMLILCHSDGDNFGMKNSDAWHAQHGFFLNMAQSNGDFDNTTVQDYLQMYPVPQNDVIHVEPGSWVGIDGGTPYFDKWRENNAGGGGNPNEHPDFWSWSVIVAAQNRVLHAEKLEGTFSMNDVQWGIGSDTAKAWHFYLQAETSCHWYWDYDRANPWDGNATRGCNLSVTEANKVLARHPGVDSQAPSIFPPQRTVYNPGGKHFNEAGLQPSDFQVWSFVDDVSGLADVRLMWRADNDGANPLSENDNEVYAHNAAKVGAWNVASMTNTWYPADKGPQVPTPLARAKKYNASITGQQNVLLDYFIEAVDTFGNTNRSDIMHVFVGTATNGPVGPVVTVSPSPVEICKPVTITYNPTNRPLQGVTPVKIQIDWEPSVSPPVAPDMTNVNGFWVYGTEIPAGQTNMVFYFHNGAGTVDNNSNQNWSAAISVCSTGPAATLSFDPPIPNGCTSVTLHYSPNYGPLKNSTNIQVHIGRNGWSDVILPNPVMTATGTGTWTYVYAIPEGTYAINCVFNNGAGTWDNNQGLDYGTTVTNCVAPPVPDGVTITNPPSDVTVSNDTYTLQGTASANLVGSLRWTNTLTGGSGAIPKASAWTIASLPLDFGANVITVTGTNAASGSVTNAADSGADTVYSNGWVDTDNGGFGFGAWQLYTQSTNSSQNGRFIATSTNVNIGTPAWGLYANSGNLSEAKRLLTNALQVGQTIGVKLDNGFINTGSGVGVGLQNANGDTLWQFFFNGGDTNYNITGSTTDIGWTGGGIDVQFTLTGPTSYVSRITPNGGATRTNVGHIAAATNQAITVFRAWNFNAGSGSDFDVFFNALRILSAGSGSGSSTSDTVTITRTGQSHHDGIPMSWWNRYGLGTNSAANGNNDADGASNWEEYVADTDPTNGASVFTNRLVQASGNGIMNITIPAPTTNSRVYDVWYCSNLFTGAWTPMNMNAFGPADGSSFLISITNEAAWRAYRTGVKLP